MDFLRTVQAKNVADTAPNLYFLDAYKLVSIIYENKKAPAHQFDIESPEPSKA